MASKNSVYVTKSNLENLKKLSDKKSVPVSSLLNQILTNLEISREGTKPMVLQIPVDLLSGKKEDLKLWLECKSEAILKLFYQ